MVGKREVGDRVRQLRQKHRVSQTQLGNFLGKSHAAISDIERGKTALTAIELTKIAGFFKVSIAELLEEENLRPYIKFRDSKKLTPKQKEIADQAMHAFINFAEKYAKERK